MGKILQPVNGSCMSSFPIVLVPASIQQAKSQLPPLPEFQVPQPVEPGPAPERTNTTAIAVEATAATVPSVVIATQPQGVLPGVLLFIAAAGAIAAQVWRQVTTYPKRQRQYEAERTTYAREVEVYKQRKLAYEREAATARTPDKLAAFQLKLLMDVLRKVDSYDGNGSKAQRGRAEPEFYEYLKRYFPGKIHTGLTLAIPGYDYPYTPDFAYIDSQTNLHIDIEIDEPYVYRSGEPTHYLGSVKDENRNQFFLNKGWMVIRFCEEQVARWPDQCCWKVIEVIAEVLGDKSVLDSSKQYTSTLPTIRQWTKSEADTMARNKYRDS